MCNRNETVLSGSACPGRCFASGATGGPSGLFPAMFRTGPNRAVQLTPAVPAEFFPVMRALPGFLKQGKWPDSKNSPDKILKTDFFILHLHCFSEAGCSSARLEYTSGGRVVAGSNPVTPTN